MLLTNYQLKKYIKNLSGINRELSETLSYEDNKILDEYLPNKYTVSLFDDYKRNKKTFLVSVLKCIIYIILTNNQSLDYTILLEHFDNKLQIKIKTTADKIINKIKVSSSSVAPLVSSSSVIPAVSSSSVIPAVSSSSVAPSLSIVPITPLISSSSVIPMVSSSSGKPVSSDWILGTDIEPYMYNNIGTTINSPFFIIDSLIATRELFDNLNPSDITLFVTDAIDTKGVNTKPIIIKQTDYIYHNDVIRPLFRIGQYIQDKHSASSEITDVQYNKSSGAYLLNGSLIDTSKLYLFDETSKTWVEYDTIDEYLASISSSSSAKSASGKSVGSDIEEYMFSNNRSKITKSPFFIIDSLIATGDESVSSDPLNIILSVTDVTDVTGANTKPITIKQTDYIYHNDRIRPLFRIGQSIQDKNRAPGKITDVQYNKSSGAYLLNGSLIDTSKLYLFDETSKTWVEYDTIDEYLASISSSSSASASKEYFMIDTLEIKGSRKIVTRTGIEKVELSISDTMTNGSQIFISIGGRNYQYIRNLFRPVFENRQYIQKKGDKSVLITDVVETGIRMMLNNKTIDVDSDKLYLFDEKSNTWFEYDTIDEYLASIIVNIRQIVGNTFNPMYNYIGEIINAFDIKPANNLNVILEEIQEIKKSFDAEIGAITTNLKIDKDSTLCRIEAAGQSQDPTDFEPQSKPGWLLNNLNIIKTKYGASAGPSASAGPKPGASAPTRPALEFLDITNMDTKLFMSGFIKISNIVKGPNKWLVTLAPPSGGGSNFSISLNKTKYFINALSTIRPYFTAGERILINGNDEIISTGGDTTIKYDNNKKTRNIDVFGIYYFNAYNKWVQVANHRELQKIIEDGTIDTKQKYLKYKQKYLNLKNNK
jgi:hypothetical protein